MAVVSSLLEQVMKVPQTRAQSMGNMGNMASILETNQIVSGLVTNNKLLKENYKSYSRCLLPLMNEAVTHQQLLSVLKSVLNHLICCDGFTYILCKDDHLLVYQSNNDLSTVVPLNVISMFLIIGVIGIRASIDHGESNNLAQQGLLVPHPTISL